VHPPPAGDAPEPKKRRIEDDAGAGARYPALVRANAHLAQVHAVIKRECLELAESCDQCKLWINLSMPRIEECVRPARRALC
jgi:proteasome activator subunit 3 (PA28 gamma)